MVNDIGKWNIYPQITQIRLNARQNSMSLRIGFESVPIVILQPVFEA